MSTLHYLPLRARGEAIKLMLHFGGIEFRDNIIAVTEWPKYKSDPNICPFGQVPSLELPSGTAIAQSGAIARYVAKLAKLYPEDFEKAAIADMLFELTQEMNMINPLANWFDFDSDKFRSEKEAYFAQLPARLDFIEKTLGSKQFLADEKPTHADFGIFHILDLTTTVEPAALSGHPNVAAWDQRMRSLPAVAAYLEARPRPGTPNWGKPGSFLMSAENKA